MIDYTTLKESGNKKRIAAFVKIAILFWRSGWDSTCPAGQATSGCKAPPAPCQVPSGSNPNERTAKKKQPPFRVTVSFWRSGWDSNPRAREGQRFSRPPRYDRFDTAAYKIPAAANAAAGTKVEAPSGFEPEQSRMCSPLPYRLAMAPLERATRFELATSTLARWRSAK